MHHLQLTQLLLGIRRPGERALLTRLEVTPMHPRSLGPGGSLIASSMENSRDQDPFRVAIVDDIALDDERADAVAELRPTATDAGLVAEQLESVEERVDEPIGGRRGRLLGNVEPDLVEVLLGKGRQPIAHLRFLGARRTTARLDPIGELPS